MPTSGCVWVMLSIGTGCKVAEPQVVASLFMGLHIQICGWGISVVVQRGVRSAAG